MVCTETKVCEYYYKGHEPRKRVVLQYMCTTPYWILASLLLSEASQLAGGMAMCENMGSIAAQVTVIFYFKPKK